MNVQSIENSTGFPSQRGTYCLKVTDRDLAIQGLQKIFETCIAADGAIDVADLERELIGFQKGSRLVFHEGCPNFRALFSPAAVSEDSSQLSDADSNDFHVQIRGHKNVVGDNNLVQGSGSVIIQIIVNGNAVLNEGSSSSIAADQRNLPSARESHAAVCDRIRNSLHQRYSDPGFTKMKRFIYPTVEPISKSFIDLSIRTQKSTVEDKSLDKSDLGPKESQSAEVHKISFESEESIAIGQFFDPPESGGELPKRLLIVGPPGTGKSVLCQYLANAWVEHPEKLNEWKVKFNYLFLIRLRDLKEDQNEVSTIAELIGEQVPEIPLQKIKTFLDKEANQILFLLDGYDEVVDWLNVQKNSRGRGLFQQVISFPHWILTTRHDSWGKLNGLGDYRKVTICGFTRPCAKEYIDRFFENPRESDLATTLKKSIDDDLRISDLASTPITLEFLCSVWKRKGSQMNFLTTTKLYKEIISFVFQRFMEKWLDQDPTGMQFSLIEMDTVCGPLLETIEAVAWRGLLDPNASSMIIPDMFEEPITQSLRSLRTQNLNVSEFYAHFFDNLGFFQTSVTSKESLRRDYRSYFFSHQTFQEYFAARYFVRKVLKGGLVDGKRDWKKFLEKEKFNPRFWGVYRFVAGLLAEQAHLSTVQQSEETPLDDFFNQLLREPRSLLRVHEMALAMRCFEELDKVKISSIQTMLEEFTAILGGLIKWFYKANFINYCPDFFQGINKFYLEDTEGKILKTLLANFPSYERVSLIGKHRLFVPGIIDFLLAMIDDNDRFVPGIVMFTIVHYCSGEDAENRIVSTLISRLAGAEARKREEAVELLRYTRLSEKAKKEIAAALIPRLNNKDSEVREDILEALRRLKPKGESRKIIFQALVQKLDDDDAHFRKSIIYYLGDFWSDMEDLDEAMEAFISRLEDVDPTVQRVATKSLGMLSPGEEEIVRISQIIHRRLNNQKVKSKFLCKFLC